MYLDAQGLDVVGAVSTAREVREVELDLVPTFVESHWHRADERLDARRALVVTRSESSTNVLIIQHLPAMYHSCTYRPYTLLKVNVEISTFGGRSQGLPRGRNISSSTKGRIVLPL